MAALAQSGATLGKTRQFPARRRHRLRDLLFATATLLSLALRSQNVFFLDVPWFADRTGAGLLPDPACDRIGGRD
ncbi:MAG: hypothetical protein KF723_00435 [Rhizobiaceae bacterium]|nr:hypothetical protein [Rhizobiaceae bacterium]